MTTFWQYYQLYNYLSMIQMNNQVSQQEESNLLDSDSPINTQKHGFSGVLDQDQSSDFLNKVEDLLNNTEEQKMSKQEILLQAQVIELQNKCNHLSVVNRKLVQKMCQVSMDEAVENSQLNESEGIDDLSLIQTQFGEIESVIKSYREQFEHYQNLITEEKQGYEQEILRLNQQINLKDRKVQSLESEVTRKNNEIGLLIRKNQQLLLEIEDISDNKYQELNQSFNKLNESFDHELEQELERIIESLASELQYERNVKKKLNEQIKRVSQDLIEQEKTIQAKNQVIYELELKLLNKKARKPDFSYRIQREKLHSQRSFKSPSYQKKSISKPPLKICMLSDLSKQVVSYPPLPLFIALKIINMYNKHCKQSLPKAKMTHNNIQIVNLNMENISDAEIRLETQNSLKTIAKTSQEYFWSTFDLIECLIISVPLQSYPSLKKQMQRLSQCSRNRKKINKFDWLQEAIISILNKIQY